MSNSSSSVTEKRLADYFVICGLDLSSGLEPDQLAGNLLLCFYILNLWNFNMILHYHYYYFNNYLLRISWLSVIFIVSSNEKFIFYYEYLKSIKYRIMH